MDIKNVSGRDLQLPSIGKVVADGDTVEVPDELVDGLLEQSAVWAKPKAPASTATSSSTKSSKRKADA